MGRRKLPTDYVASKRITVAVREITYERWKEMVKHAKETKKIKRMDDLIGYLIDLYWAYRGKTILT